MKTSEINIRDPYVLTFEDKYYLYGTRAATTWGKMTGFDCYVGEDLENWQGPFEIFQRPDDFWADQNYWAPECYFHRGQFYLITTLGAADRKKGIHVLTATNPLGPFNYVAQLTPTQQECIDGTVYQENGHSFLVYSRTFQDSRDGDMYALELKEDWLSAQGEPFKLFSAKEAAWAQPIPFAKAEFAMEGAVYFTDGPSLVKNDEKLLMLWSSWGDGGYSVGVATSQSKKIAGPWQQTPRALIENGGHGMIFKDLTGKLLYTYHYPNTFEEERPQFLSLEKLLSEMLDD